MFILSHKRTGANMHIYSVSDPEFKSYGNVWDDVPSELTLLVLEALPKTIF